MGPLLLCDPCPRLTVLKQPLFLTTDRNNLMGNSSAGFSGPSYGAKFIWNNSLGPGRTALSPHVVLHWAPSWPVRSEGMDPHFPPVEGPWMQSACWPCAGHPSSCRP